MANNKIAIIAEAGKNFIDFKWQDSKPEDLVEICFFNALKLASAAKKAGADIVKFQTHVLEDEKEFRDKSRWDWIKFNEEVTPLNKFWEPLKEFCDAIGIELLTTPMSKLAAQKINHLVKRWKIGSGNVTDIKLFEFIARTKKPVILSTGMSTQKQVEKALKILKNNEITLTYCKSIYPCPVDKIDIGIITKIGNHFKRTFKNVKKIGFSDHTMEITTPLKVMVETNIDLVEKHFTLNKEAHGPDHFFSLEPDEFKKMVRLIRDYEDVEPPILFYPEEEEIKLWDKFRK